MTIPMLLGKIHRATVTQADLNYVGSITVDKNFLDKAGIREYQKVEIADVDNGERFSTYTIAGEPGSGIICLNGAAARCACTGDKVIIMAYCEMTPEEADQYAPKVVFLGEGNRIERVTNYERHGRLEDMK
ncbi:MAG: aspartate 1-decarboxylase [Eubacterium sp.]|jgi:aspartate 1-decarboxylase|nr:aspartate 1-decarboxylase [Eubacterium sp.]MCH4046724.1 aspartate 1-decarboxylase [Eubacterium sp.]MCH4079821.1 aspartate 1-decarboxylase [Eubacterium sp.]MCH4110380.1 aspartate 1-decarboxylase [Eubacterium sp.]MCI1306440.1 aspartate 1-decarboxylase [Eubacterium sp.]